MASLNFTDRFKSKIEKIGKDGVFSLATQNPIEKSVTERKIHDNILAGLPSVPKIRIVKNFPIDERQEYQNTMKSTRSTTPTILPLLRASPTSLSGILSNKKSKEAQETTSNLTSSGYLQKDFIRLPVLKAKFQSIKSVLRPY